MATVRSPSSVAARKQRMAISDRLATRSFFTRPSDDLNLSKICCVTTPRDVILIGPGIVGCAVAYELARRGASVEIVDDRPAGSGATQASAGVLGPFVEAREEGALLELTGR